MKVFPDEGNWADGTGGGPSALFCLPKRKLWRAIFHDQYAFELYSTLQSILIGFAFFVLGRVCACCVVLESPRGMDAVTSCDHGGE